MLLQADHTFLINVQLYFCLILFLSLGGTEIDPNHIAIISPNKAVMVKPLQPADYVCLMFGGVSVVLDALRNIFSFVRTSLIFLLHSLALMEIVMNMYLKKKSKVISYASDIVRHFGTVSIALSQKTMLTC